MAAPQSIEPDSVLPRTAWLGVLQETAVEVFSSMVGRPITTLADDIPRISPEVTGIVGIAGAMRANFILQCSASSSTRIASKMLGISPEDPSAEKAARDALGEICNIVAGYFKARIGLGDVCMLSVPTIISGRGYKFRAARMFEKLELAVSYEGESLLATLEVAR